MEQLSLCVGVRPVSRGRVANELWARPTDVRKRVGHSLDGGRALCAGGWNPKRGGRMYARLTVTQSRPDQIDDARRFIENDVVPATKLLPGFKGGYWAVDRTSGKAVGLTLFATETDLTSSEAAAQKIRKQA